MSAKKKLEAILATAIDVAIADSGSPPIQIEPSTRLVGEACALDSLTLVMVVVALERLIEEQFGIQLLLSEREDILDANGPFRTSEALITYLDDELMRVGAA